jgi:undecaprenyl-diphosphatase
VTFGAEHAPGSTLREWVTRIDAAVDARIEELRSPQLDHIAYALGSAADHSLLWFAVGAVRAAWSGDARWYARMAGAQAIESFTTNIAVKSLFRRARPVRPATDTGPQRPLPYGMRVPVTTSFPSGHAAAAFTAAAFLSEGAGAIERAGWYGLATAVSLSRMYVRMHHASDVVVGAALGVAYGAVLRRVLR